MTSTRDRLESLVCELKVAAPSGSAEALLSRNVPVRTRTLAWLDALERESQLERVHMHRAMTLAARLGDVEGVLLVSWRMVRHGMRPNRSQANHILLACARAGDLRTAEYCYQWMLSWSLKPNRTSHCCLVTTAVACHSIAGTERWVRKLQTNGIIPPSGWLRQLLSVLHRPVSKLLQNASPEEGQLLTQFEEAWLLWLLELAIPMDSSSLRLVLSQVAHQMWQYRVEPSPTIKEYLAQCVLRSRQEIVASCHFNLTANPARSESAPTSNTATTQQPTRRRASPSPEGRARRW